MEYTNIHKTYTNPMYCGTHGHIGIEQVSTFSLVNMVQVTGLSRQDIGSCEGSLVLQVRHG